MTCICFDLQFSFNYSEVRKAGFLLKFQINGRSPISIEKLILFSEKKYQFFTNT